MCYVKKKTLLKNNFSKIGLFVHKMRHLIDTFVLAWAYQIDLLDANRNHPGPLPNDKKTEISIY